jgi:hypothetical protein
MLASQPKKTLRDKQQAPSTPLSKKVKNWFCSDDDTAEPIDLFDFQNITNSQSTFLEFLMNEISDDAIDTVIPN